MEQESFPSAEGKFEPSEATLIAWRARSLMLLFGNSEPGSTQAESAREEANQVFSELVDLTLPDITYWTFQNTSGNREEAEDIIQSTYLKAYSGLKGFRGDCQIETWLCTVMTSATNTYYKKRNKDSSRQIPSEINDSLLEELSEFSTTESPEWYGEQQLLQKKLVAAVEELSPRVRLAVVLRHAYGVTYKEIAERLNVTENNAKIIVFRALAKLRENRQLKREVDNSE